jgi:hypothetical protein
MRTYFTALLPILATVLLVNPGYGQSQSQSGFTAGPSAPAPDAPPSVRRRGDYDPLLDLPPLKPKQVTLIGGVVISMDEVMNRMVLQPFGTKQKLRVHFDTRTRFYLEGKEITEREVKLGQRVYLDSMLNGDRVFAKSIWIRTSAESGVGRGQIMDFDPGHKVVTVLDELSNQPIRMQLTPTTTVRKGSQQGSESDLVQGALVSIEFGAQRELRAITVLAIPGTTFVFAGRVTYVDLSQKLIAIDNQSDAKKYDVFVEAIAPSVLRQVHEGQEISVSAVFDGERYSARRLDFVAAKSSQ